MFGKGMNKKWSYESQVWDGKIMFGDGVYVEH